MKRLTSDDDYDDTLRTEGHLLKFMRQNSCVDAEFMVWFFDQLRGLERFIEKDETFEGLLNRLSNVTFEWAHVDDRFITPRVIRMLSELPLFDYRVSARVDKELKVWRPYEESFRVFCCKAETDRFSAWHAPYHLYNNDDIYSWLKKKHEDFISKIKAK